MPKYIVDGTIHQKFKITIEAENDIKAKEKVQKMSGVNVIVSADNAGILTVTVNPTVEKIQG